MNFRPSYCGLCHWPKCELVTQLISPFKTSFCNFVEFSTPKMIKFHYLTHIRSKIYKIISTKSHSLWAFHQYQEHTLISLELLVLILSNAQWKNYSILNNSCTVGLNQFSSVQLQLLESFSTAPRVQQETLRFGRSQCDKQTY